MKQLRADCLPSRGQPWWETLAFELPSPQQHPGCSWLSWLGSSRAAICDMVPWSEMEPIEGSTHELPLLSFGILLSRAR